MKVLGASHLFANVSTAKVITDKVTGRSRGFGFVEMSDGAAAQKAIAELDNGIVDGRTINVMEVKPKEERPARSNNYNNLNSYNKNRY